MHTDKAAVESLRRSAIGTLDAELESLALAADAACLRYYEWYAKAETIRRIFYNIIYRFQPSWEHPYRKDGHYLDHHLYGYISPLINYRIGLNKGVLNASEQLSLFANTFAERGIRFIYVALPCKVAVYPEILLPKSVYERLPNIIPQWRFMIRGLLERGVETLDLLPYLMDKKSELQSTGLVPFPKPHNDNRRPNSCGLYGFYHYISPIGSDVIAEYVASYLAATTQGIQSATNLKLERCTFEESNSLYDTGRIMELNSPSPPKLFDSRNISSDIGIFGNCNLQRYLGTGMDLASKISYHLGYPLQYCGRILPFDRNWERELEKIPDGIFKNRKILIYVGFPSASFVRSVGPINKRAHTPLPQRFF